MFSFFKKCFCFVKNLFSKKKSKTNKIKSVVLNFVGKKEKEKNEFLHNLVEFVLNEFGFAKYIKLYSLFTKALS
ncbi:hypothetical protein [Campylobacter canadensis]|uniref:Uncharacterized protein n=1 Tax=Campylobacter canadensis TaxID=449520 RepID=A0ABS7WT01_9BACT|nr:hypothetical protein [Campylobacter canadensis]MBZ7987903.1 hypothetical protein [Campylobacter canadensis]MBZ7995353.1 hypothetical protein [Campylobacter canadensis]MBZ7996321.1 hypothetical protein [Campylobacter canadensis]MBZ7998353.1 hypothetical protein [Campylobacter canadensis]MBZ8000068.1 hypothetical protein [Campylobacter canadensis]